MASTTSLYISFAGTYYTLWEVTVEKIITETYSYDDVRAQYIKNISMDKDVVLELYPDTPWNTNLQGRSMCFRANEKRTIVPHTFKYGKYCGMLYEECTDYKYMVWYFNNTSFEDRYEISEDIKPLVDVVVANTDYVCYKGNGGYYDLLSKEEYEDAIEYEEYNNKVASTFKEGYAIVDVENNWLSKNEEGYYELATYDKYHFYFEDDNVKYYEGNYYSSGGYKPAIKGKGKNLKNKQVKLYITPASINEKYNWCVGREFIVTGFEIL